MQRMVLVFSREKINSLSQIHQEKEKNLLNSIVLLKKEVQSLTKLQKEHKISEIIDSQNKLVWFKLN